MKFTIYDVAELINVIPEILIIERFKHCKNLCFDPLHYAYLYIGIAVYWRSYTDGFW